jgi:hypothetical protein
MYDSALSQLQHGSVQCCSFFGGMCYVLNFWLRRLLCARVSVSAVGNTLLVLILCMLLPSRQ